MAYIKFYEGNESKWLDLPGDDLYIRNGKVYRRKKPKRPKRYTPWIQRIVETFQDTGRAWQATWLHDRAIWKQYIPYAPDSISHYNAMLTCNVRARYPRIPALATGPLGPRVPADPPHTPKGLALDFLSASNQLKITWDPDYTELAYIQLFHFIVPGRRRYRPYWKYITSYYSGTAEAYIPGNKLCAGHVSMVTIRALNAYGEISDLAEPEEEEIDEEPTPLFSATPLTGAAPLTTQFTDESTGTIYAHLWEFGDNTFSTDMHPQHTYTPEAKYFHVTLNIYGPAESAPYLQKVNYIHTTAPVPTELWLFVADKSNHRIFKRLKADLTYLDKVGSQGSGDDQFDSPYGVANDLNHILIADNDNHRIMKRKTDDLTYVSKFGTEGSGDNQFRWPTGINCDETYVYISDNGNHRIKKHLKSDLSYVAKIGSYGSGDNQFAAPNGTAVDDTHIFIADTFNCRLKKHLKSDLSYVAKIGSWGSGNDQFSFLRDVCCDETYLYVMDAGNHRIVKRLKSDLTYVSKFGSYGSGDNQFDGPQGIAVKDDYLYIADTNNHRIKIHLKSDLSYVAKLGSQGSGNDQFQSPTGTSVLTQFAQ